MYPPTQYYHVLIENRIHKVFEYWIYIKCVLLNTIILGIVMNNFKPIKPEKTVISIRIDVELLKTVDELSAKTDISRNELIVQCIDYAVKNFKSD